MIRLSDPKNQIRKDCIITKYVAGEILYKIKVTEVTDISFTYTTVYHKSGRKHTDMAYGFNYFTKIMKMRPGSIYFIEHPTGNILSEDNFKV